MRLAELQKMIFCPAALSARRPPSAAEEARLRLARVMYGGGARMNAVHENGNFCASSLCRVTTRPWPAMLFALFCPFTETCLKCHGLPSK